MHADIEDKSNVYVMKLFILPSLRPVILRLSSKTERSLSLLKKQTMSTIIYFQIVCCFI